MKKNLLMSIIVSVVIGSCLFAGGVTEDTTYAKTILERKDSISTYFQQVVQPFTLKNGPLQLTAVPLLSETYVLSEYPDMKNKRYSTTQMTDKLGVRTKALDRQQEMSGTFLVFLRYERSEEFLGLSSFIIDPSFFEYMFLDNDKGDFLRVGNHPVVRAKTVDAYNKVLEFWVTFGENDEERKKFFQDSKTVSISVTDFGFEGQVISYELPISGMYSDIPKEPKEILTSMRSSLKVAFEGAATPGLTGQTLGSLISEPEKPSRKGYAFGGWYKDAQYNQAWDFKKDAILDDTTLYAKWTANEYMVTLDRNGGEGGTISVNVRTDASMPYVLAPKKSGYSFKGYYDGKDGKGTAYYSDQMKSLKAWDKGESAILYAKWGAPGVGDIGPVGGYIFYDKGSYSDGWRYLEAAPAEYEFEEKVWGGYRTEVGGTATTIGSGKSNTEKIVAKFGNAEPYGKKTDYAAKLCADLVVTKDGVVYDDWFLPSKDELNQMYLNLRKNKLGGFSEANYWSSSEYFAYVAWGQYFDGGTQAISNRYNEGRVRPVRAF